MKKKLLLVQFFILSSVFAFSQAKSIKDLYWDYTQNRMIPDAKQEVIHEAEALLQRKTELNNKQIANLNYHLGRLYEEIDEAKAIPYYEATIQLEPGYYVPYRALAFINIKKCNALAAEVSEAGKQKNIPLYTERLAVFKKQVLKTLPFMEKAQACDPDDEMLDMITKYYTSIKDTKSLDTLPYRLKKLSETCITLLDDE